MTRSLMPWRGTAVWADGPMLALRRDMDRLFDEFFGETGLAPFSEEWAAFSPRVDVTEDDKQILVSVELPGLNEKDIEVALSGDVLTISGEKKREREEKAENRYHTERSFGAFRRSIPLPCEVDAGKAAAIFEKGVLTITLSKMESVQDRKRIAVRSGESRS